MKYAVIDLSSTGVSTVIADGDKATGIFNTVYKDRANIAITEYLDGKSINKRGVDKIIDALITARSNCKAMGADECYVISTAALRNVDNLEEIAERIRMRTGIVINHLDGNTEAYCDFVSNKKYAAYDKVILIDIGGGSVELCDFSNDKKSGMVCLDFGPLKLRNKYVDDIYPTEEEAKRIKKFLRKKCDEAELPKKGKFATAVLVGSINDAIFAAYREFCEKKNTGSGEFSYDGYKKFIEMLLTSSERTSLLMKVAPEKINVLPVAALILKELLKRFKLDNVVISDCGVKEGYLSLVAMGIEDGVKVDLSSSIPAFSPIADVDGKKKPSKQSDRSKGKSSGSAPKKSNSAPKKSSGASKNKTGGAPKKTKPTENKKQ